MSDDLVSVIIPTYNRAGSIWRAVDSVLAQTHHELDVIVVDDGSTDDTGALITRRYGTDSRVRYLHQPNRGVAAARNLGLNAARGEFVALLDSDDVWKPWKLELQICVLRAIPEAGMIWTDMEAIGPEGEIVSRHYLRTMYSATYRWFPEDKLFPNVRALAKKCPRCGSLAPGARVFWGDIFSPMVMGNLVHTSTVLMRRSRLAQVIGFNETLRVSGEDYDFHLRTCREGPVAFLDVSSIQYQIGRSDQLTHRTHAIHMARNFLGTITPVLEHDRDRIALPPPMIARLQAFAHAWIGVEHIEIGELALARQSLWRSLHYRPWQPKTWLYGALTLLPPANCHSALRRLRAIKRRLAALIRSEPGGQCSAGDETFDLK